MRKETNEIKEHIHQETKKMNTWWNSNTKRQKIWFIISLIITLFTAFTMSLVLSMREIGLVKEADALFGEGVSGWQWLGLQLGNAGIRVVMTLICVCVALVVIFILNLLIGLFTWKGKRSKTIGSLIKSLIKYIVTIIAIGFILSYWGVDIASIVAGLGIITLIIGLGCQSLISDIVSGLFLVFDDFFDVGDIVVIDSFRGTISEIGLRSTKLLDWAGNIKSINNSQINTVINLSRLATSTAIQFYVDREEDIERAEAIIADNLEEISNKLPKLIDPLKYLGVSGLDETGIRIQFLAKCEESDRFQIGRDVNRELYLLMNRNGVKVPFNKIYIHQDPERKVIESSKEDKAKAEYLNEQNRIVNK